MTRREGGFGALMEPLDDAPRPNGSRLSCGRDGRVRKAVQRQTKRPAREVTQFFPLERPAASSAC